MNFLTRQLKPLAAIFRPPFAGLGLAVLLYYAWCFIVYPHSPITQGDLPDTDDYMYLNQVLDWLNGQGWFDNLQHRLNPPPDGSVGGVPIHFSRLAQLPMAALILLFRLTGLGPKGAALLMSIIYPLILLGGFFATLRFLAQSFLPREWAGVTAFVALFAGGTMFMFQPGHIDHHGLGVVIVALAFAFTVRMMMSPERYRWGVAAGASLAFGLVIALEILPWLLLLSAWLGLWAMVKGGAAARNGFIYALTLMLAAAAGLLLTRPPGDLLTTDVLTYSVIYVVLCGGIFVAFAGLALAARAPLPLRAAVGVVLAVGSGFLFLHRFPDLISGPYGGIDPALSQIILEEINEALPYKTPEVGWFALTRISGGALIALVANGWFFWRGNREERWRWGLSLLLLTAAIALTLFYQRRFVAVMGMLSVVPLAALLQRGWAAIGAGLRGRPRVYAEIGLLLLVGPLPSVLYPALFDQRSFNTGVLLFPAMRSHDTAQCGMYRLENVLRDPVYYGDRSRLIMATLGEGPELLFRTQHKVLAAPFHMDVDGNVDATRFFSTPYPEEAEAIARRRHIDLVVACRYIPEAYLRSGPGGTEGTTKDFAPHFIMRLMSGRVPAWLKPVPIPGLDNYVIYEVRPSAAAPAAQ